MLSDQDLLHILSQSRDATAIYDSPDLNIRFVNDMMLRFWGKERDVTGKTLEDALPELEGQPFIGLLKDVWRTGKTYTATDTPATLLIDGKPKTSFFDFEYCALKDHEGKVYAILHTSVDVSGRIQAWEQIHEKQKREKLLIAELTLNRDNARAANADLSAANRELQLSNDNINRLNFRLQESETDFKRLVEQSPVAILVFRGPELVIDLANQPILDILGKDAGIIGKPLLAGMPELKGEPAVDLLFDVYNKGISSDGKDVPVLMMTNGKLETRYFNFSYRPLRDEGQIIGVMDLAVEVTEQVLARKKLEAIITEKSFLEIDLRANQQRLQAVLDTMAEGVVILDTRAKPTYANPMAQRIMGLDEAQFKAREYNDSKWQNERVDGTPLPAEDHPMNVVLRTGLAVYDQEIAVRRPGHELLYISVNAAPLIDGQQQVSGVIVTFMDVTNRRLIMQQKDDFISVASHELKTPVTSLKAAIQLLERMQDNIKPEVLSKLVDQANRSLNKLSDLVNSLLNSNRISEGRFPLHKTNFSINHLINDCCQHVRTAGNHELILNGETDLLVSADEQLLDQVIVNLVNNAVKYAPQSKQIVIDVQKAGEFARITVTDFGPGIPQDKIKYLFERYYQVQHGSQQFSGLGLGLYICAEIIRKHGGEIGVDSEPGKGSTFWFTLPLIG
jgi:PAS domain S-box-containing protein